MKVLLVPSPYIVEGRPKSIVQLGLISIATVLRNGNVNVEILDINAVSADAKYSNIPRKIAGKRPDIVGFTTMGAYYHITLDLARQCKEINPKIKVMLGGPQATQTALETINAFPWVDVVVRGEAETNILQVIEYLSRCCSPRDVPGITFRNGGEVVQTSAIAWIEDLDCLPDPQYELFPTIGDVEEVYVEEGRGCPYGCTFCGTNQFWGRRFRTRSVGRIVDLLRKIKSLCGEKASIGFVQDTPFLSKNRILELCDAIQRANLSVPWRCFSRIDLVDKTILRRMAEAGCESIFFGIESGSPRMQERIGKNIDLRNVPQAVDWIVDAGITYTASFIIGFPDETLDDMESTLDMLTMLLFRSPLCKTVQLHALSPLAGSQLYKRYNHSLRFDGMFWGAWNSRIMSREHVHMIRHHPDIFPSFHYYPGEFVDRRALLRIAFIFRRLLHMPCTLFVLARDPILEYPGSILRHNGLVELPANYGTEYGLDNFWVNVSRFLETLLDRLGQSGHFLRDVIRFELAVKRALHFRSGEPIVETFKTRVEEFVRQVHSNAFRSLPAIVPCEPRCVLFRPKDDSVAIMELPSRIAEAFL